MPGAQRTNALFAAAASHPESRAFRGAEGRTVRFLAHWTFLLVLASIAWFVVLIRRDVEARGFERIETTRSRLDHGPGWVDPRWEQEIAWTLAQYEDLHPEDRAGLEGVAASLSELSFVEQIGEVTVLWPDGLRIEVQLREPVACVHVGRQYLTVAADGTVLSGLWSAPPVCGSGWLPVVCLPGGAEFDPAPGDVLTAPMATDGLAVAESLWSELAPSHVAKLGRIAIDAARSRVATPDEPGCALLLEGRRRVYFGRSPNLNEPGETPVRIKWASVGLALDRLDGGAEGPVDWAVADVRWDHPEMGLREPEED